MLWVNGKSKVYVLTVTAHITHISKRLIDIEDRKAPVFRKKHEFLWGNRKKEVLHL